MWTGWGFLSRRDGGTLPRSGYTEQPRALALGQAIGERRPESGARRWERWWNNTRRT
jgi:hypothetical protein